MKKTIKVEGMKCEHCAAKLEQMLNTVEGVTARVDFPTCTATLEADHDIPDDDLRGMVDFAGYQAVEMC